MKEYQSLGEIDNNFIKIHFTFTFITVNKTLLKMSFIFTLTLCTHSLPYVFLLHLSSNQLLESSLVASTTLLNSAPSSSS